MKFLKLNCWGVQSYTFPLDFIGLISPNGTISKIRLMNGDEIDFQMDYEELITKIFSDEPGDDKEYQLIEIDYTWAEPTDGGLFDDTVV